jgi:hypothetical protein
MANVAKITPSPRWTAADQAELERLTALKREITEAAIKPLSTYLSDNLPGLLRRDARNLADWLAQDAQTVRDLLQPFDLRLTVEE